MILFANGVGTSTLFVWNADGRYQRLKVNIVAGDTGRVAREVAAFLAAMPKARASIIGDKVIVEGEELSDSDLAKIEVLAKRYPQIVNFTNRLGWEQMVLMNVKVVEFPITELRELGLKWSAVGGAAIGAIWSPGTRQRRLTDHHAGRSERAADHQRRRLEQRHPGAQQPQGAQRHQRRARRQFNLLAQEGGTTVLAEPQLSARNGSKASFLAGGEFPYTVSTINGQTVIFKPYGVKLDIQPRVDPSGVIRAIIETEFSQIDTSVSTPAGPALLTRKTNTEFNVRNGETIVLGGLIQRENSTNIDKVPLLGDVPVLGALFRRSASRTRKPNWSSSSRRPWWTPTRPAWSTGSARPPSGCRRTWAGALPDRSAAAGPRSGPARCGTPSID